MQLTPAARRALVEHKDYAKRLSSFICELIVPLGSVTEKWNCAHADSCTKQLLVDEQCSLDDEYKECLLQKKNYSAPKSSLIGGGRKKKREKN